LRPVHEITKITDDMGLRIESESTLDGLEKYADAWDLLAFNDARQHPVLTHAWISASLKTCVPSGESWFCLFALDSQVLVGVLPLISKETKLFGKRCLLLRTTVSPTRWVDFLVKETYHDRVVQLFADYLNDLRPKVIRLTMNQVVCHSPTIGIFKKGVRGCHSLFQPSGYESVISVKGSFIDYKKGLSNKLKGNLRRSNNSLKKLGDSKVIITGKNSDNREELLRFAEIEKSGWKGRAGTAIKYKNWEFYEQLVQNMDQKNWLQWYFLESENKKIAGYMVIPFGRSVFFFKTSYHEEYRTLSPGAVLTEKLVEYFFSREEYDTINFLTDFNWLLRWNVEQNQYYRITIGFDNWPSLLSTRIRYKIYEKIPMVKKLIHFFRRSIFKIDKRK